MSNDVESWCWNLAARTHSVKEVWIKNVYPLRLIGCFRPQRNWRRSTKVHTNVVAESHPLTTEACREEFRTEQIDGRAVESLGNAEEETDAEIGSGTAGIQGQPHVYRESHQSHINGSHESRPCNTISIGQPPSQGCHSQTDQLAGISHPQGIRGTQILKNGTDGPKWRCKPHGGCGTNTSNANQQGHWVMDQELKKTLAHTVLTLIVTHLWHKGFGLLNSIPTPHGHHTRYSWYDKRNPPAPNQHQFLSEGLVQQCQHGTGKGPSNLTTNRDHAHCHANCSHGWNLHEVCWHCTNLTTGWKALQGPADHQQDKTHKLKITSEVFAWKATLTNSGQDHSRQRQVHG